MRYTCSLVGLIVLAVLLSSCGGSGEPKDGTEKPPPPKYEPPPVPPLEDLLAEARQAEKVGDAADSFNAIFGYDEAIRAYQRIVDHYGKSDAAPEAKEKVKGLAEKVRDIRSWKRRLDKAKREYKKVKDYPSRMHDLHARLVRAQGEADVDYIKQAVSALLTEVETAYETGAYAEIAQAEAKAEEALSRGDYRSAIGYFRGLPDGFRTDIDAISRNLELKQSRFEKKVAEKAQVELDRADRALGERKEREALTILRLAGETYRDYQVERDIVQKERETFLRYLKVTTAEASGKTRETDLQMFRILQNGFDILPGDENYDDRLRDHVQKIKDQLEKYLAGVNAFWITQRDFQIRKNLIDKHLEMEERRISTK